MLDQRRFSSCLAAATIEGIRRGRFGEVAAGGLVVPASLADQVAAWEGREEKAAKAGGG